MRDEEKQKNYELTDRLIAEQNFAAAVIAGAVAAILAAAGYGFAVAFWPFSYGFAAAGIGIVVGLSIGYLGRGISTKFAVLATVYTLAGGLLGNFFMVILQLADRNVGSIVAVLRNHSLADLADRTVPYFFNVGLIFWLVAVFAAVFLGKRTLSRAEKTALGVANLRR